MKLLILFLGICGTAASLAIAAADLTPYEPNGTVLGDFTDVRSFPPKVLLNFLAACANVTIADSDRCLVSTFAKLRVSLDLEDTLACDNCLNPPNATDSSIEGSALEAQAACAAVGESASLVDTNTLSQQYKTIVLSTCWDSLRQDDAYLSVESKWLKTCASANLPYPIPKTLINMFTIDSVEHRSTLTCMLDNLFDSDPTVFGLPSAAEGSPESCLVPGYGNITSNCASAIGPKAFKRCSTKPGDPTPPMSMDFTGNDEAIFVEEFCEILEALNTEVGRDCLMDVCDFNPTPSPSSMPSLAPSSVPTKPLPAPSSSPAKTSSSPVVSPSTKPSPPPPVIVPFATPSPDAVTTPSSDPSQQPSSEPPIPTTKPSPAPISTPTTKTAPPTLSPSNPSTKPTKAPVYAPSTKPASPASSPSKAPSSAPSGNKPSPTLSPGLPLPSANPSAAASSIPPTKAPPSTKPSPAPISAPSDEKSFSPESSQPTTSPTTSTPSMSQFPSTNAVQAIVGVEVFAVVTINVTLEAISSGVRQAFVDVLELAFESIVEGESTATILLPLGPIRFRRLLSSDSMDLEVKVTATRDCQHILCQAYGARVVDGIEENIRTNIADGDLVKSMRALATTKNVGILQTADVYTVEFMNETITAESVVDDTDDETTSASASIGILSGFVASIAFSLLL